MSSTTARTSKLLLALAICQGLACATQDIPQAHKGQLFERTGLLRLYSGRTGFVGDVLSPGTYRTGLYGDIQMIDCSMVGENEPLNAVTKDGVQFGLEINVRFSADCSPQTVKTILATLIPDQEQTISGKSCTRSTFGRPSARPCCRWYRRTGPLRSTTSGKRSSPRSGNGSWS